MKVLVDSPLFIAQSYPVSVLQSTTRQHTIVKAAAQQKIPAVATDQCEFDGAFILRDILYHNKSG
jgi:hypothetical protein